MGGKKCFRREKLKKGRDQRKYCMGRERLIGEIFSLFFLIQVCGSENLNI